MSLLLPFSYICNFLNLFHMRSSLNQVFHINCSNFWFCCKCQLITQLLLTYLNISLLLLIFILILILLLLLVWIILLIKVDLKCIKKLRYYKFILVTWMIGSTFWLAYYCNKCPKICLIYSFIYIMLSLQSMKTLILYHQCFVSLKILFY